MFSSSNVAFGGLNVILEAEMSPLQAEMSPLKAETSSSPDESAGRKRAVH